MWVHTFHALAARLLREFAEPAGIAPTFTIYDETDQRRVLKEAMERAGVNPRFMPPEVALARIRACKDRLIKPTEARAESRTAEQATAARVYQAYQALLEERGALDFDDLLMRLALLLRQDAAVVEQLNDRFGYVLIDEYQDTNHAQYVIAHYLARHHRNICATGDPDQSIYGWRGADLNNILNFERDYPDAVVVRLEQNYRSTGAILQAASALIERNRTRREKDLWTEADHGTPVHVWTFDDDGQEAEQVAEAIARMHEEGEPYSNFAVFYRINALSRAVEDALRGRNIPYRVVRGVEFYNRTEIRDVLAYLRVLVNPADEIALRRILNMPPRGIGQITLKRLTQAARQRGLGLLDVLRRADHIGGIKRAAGPIREFVALLDDLAPLIDKPAAEAVSTVLHKTGLETYYGQAGTEAGEDRLANVRELVSAAKRYDEQEPDGRLRGFLERVSLTSDQDAVDESAGAVLLMTLHAAKGLEFPTVFIIGVEHGTLPHERTLHDGDWLEEERRLFFVGITRAQRNLFLSHVRRRSLRGRYAARSPSPFLYELPADAVVCEDFGQRQPSEANDEPRLVPEQPEESGGRRRLRMAADDTWHEADPEPVFSVDEPTAAARRAQRASHFDDWSAGTLVVHDEYGVGQVLWLRRGPSGTQACVRFAGRGEQTFVLEYAPVRRLERTCGRTRRG